MKKRRFLPGGLGVVGVVLWASSALASPAFLTPASVTQLGAGVGSLPGLLVMTLAEEGQSHRHGEHGDQAEHGEHAEHHADGEHRGHATHGEHAQQGEHGEHAEHRERGERREPSRRERPEAAGRRERPEPRGDWARRPGEGREGERADANTPRAPQMGRRPGAGGPPGWMQRGEMPKPPAGKGPGSLMGPPWMRGPAGPPAWMGRMPSVPMPAAKPQGPPWAARRPFGPPSKSDEQAEHSRGERRPSGFRGAYREEGHDAHRGTRAEAMRRAGPGRGDQQRAEAMRSQMLRRKLIEMEMRIRRLEAEVRRLRDDD